jgi:hypothetical protein
MASHLPFRVGLVAALALLWGGLPAGAQPVRPEARREMRAAQNGGVVRPVQNGANRPGLQQWMERHKNLPPAEQRRALESDPSFRALPPQQQQRAFNELNRLQNMSPEQRDRRDALLRMTPVERQQFTGSVQQYMALPPDRRMLVRRAFANLRMVPPRDRPGAMNSYPALRQFSGYERQVLSNLLTWEPYFAAIGPDEGR